MIILLNTRVHTLGDLLDNYTAGGPNLTELVLDMCSIGKDWG